MSNVVSAPLHSGKRHSKFTAYMEFYAYIVARQAYDGPLHISTNGWTDPSGVSFINVLVHWVPEGLKAESFLFDFV